ncbi:conserved hypothetical protein [Candida dubliniensis CD36]|uniref:Uncharacterized protein n=1 Tax=Candida dubliniensis (strain CD36 / ATCC MYA-646 / CBS 7987 / NCPF 3949 / NRRL Y-17841) TaxID=573826 RepID=B9WKK6_CANDC|nr:conserved hypothetical protein [Candida dubliniensis CD36]CAX39554.1 conserved hypothetical protein [Candida dubliniensis CD36]
MDPSVPSVTPFLNSVCPGYTGLDDNVHYPLEDMPNECREHIWPTATTNATIKLDYTYLNVARPALNKSESTTYVSLPLHITNMFDNLVSKSEKASEGYMHIGANVNALTHDPFKVINLNPGCITRILDWDRSNNPFADNKTLTFNKLANNFNKLFVKNDLFDDLATNRDVKILNSKPITTAKLLVSSHVNILNVFALNEKSEFMNTTKNEGTSPPDDKYIEEPVLRLEFKDSVITALSTFVLNEDPLVVLGFHSGVLMILKINQLKYQLFDALKVHKVLEVDAVTCIEAIRHPNYDYLVVAGYSNGEVVILNPYGVKQSYSKSVVDKDVSTTFFKKFDLSPLGKVDNSFVLGHFKVSHKPITSLTSTLPINKPLQPSEAQPLIVAIAADDGYVRFVDFVFTYNRNYGEKRQVITTDIISNYFNTSITDIEFSPDFKFFSVVGKGDLIEVFKMSYYNVNGLLHKSSGRRSRSGTVNSAHSGSETRLKEPKEMYPPIIKDIQIAGRFKGHTNIVKSTKFVKDDFSTSVYKLVSCGYDGKLIVWEFDYKALPKIKKSHSKPSPTSPRESRSKTSHERKQILLSPSPLARRKHTRNRSIEENHTTSMNMLLQDTNTPKPPLSSDQIEVVATLYKSLYEIRLKRHYKKKSTNQIIICPIENDKLVPSIEVPLLIIDLSKLVKDGKIDSFYLDRSTLWCFAKSGDLFRYTIST